ncbi:hypothetical protein ACIOC1_10160 [Streptomyces sp. NPDC088197]|uniref:hypothetical protein n=1 Tax=unclassified Streptomyces TaxID=2593676 RepID=UPI0033B45A48
MLLRRRATTVATVAVLALAALTAAPSAVAASHDTRSRVTAASATASPSPTGDTKKDGGSAGTSTWLIVSIFFVASVGVGFLLSGRKGRRQR